MTHPQPDAAAAPDAPSRGRRVVLVLLGILLALVLVVAAVLALRVATRETTIREESIAPEEVDALAVRGEAGALRIIVEDRDDIAVTTALTSSLWDRATSSIDASDRTLSVASDCERAWFLSECRADQSVILPPEAVGSLEVEATAGDIEIDGFAGELEVATTAGRIELSGFAGDVARVETTAGEITVDAVVAPRSLEITTTAGEVDVVVPDDGYRISTDTTVGDVDVEVRQDPDADRVIAVSTTAGEIRIRPR